ncbi:MAG TPA: M48 family metallopeptidase [Polyangiaceae bacterium]|nr:M48 family metallopeptidase [Polyangiaceae bacterium]
MDGETALDHVACASLQEGHLVVTREDGATLARWPIRDVRADPIHEGSVVHLECGAAPGTLVTVSDAELVARLRAEGARIGGTPGGRRAIMVGLASLLLFGSLMGGLWVAAPRLSARIAERVPLETERKLSSSMAGWVTRRTCSAPGVDDALRRMVARLDPDHSIAADVHVINVSMPNAFALPGGTVLVTRGLLEQADDEDEIEGVLAHELSHVKHRHALAHVIRSAMLGGVWAVTLGDYSGLMVVDPKTAYDTATLRYSREAEAEADAGALDMLTRRGISTQGLVNFLQRNGHGEESELAWLSTHPASPDRVRTLSTQKLQVNTNPALDRETLYRLRKACESTASATSLRDLFF